MKIIATLALVMALVGMPAVNAAANTFTMWDYFPQNDASPYGFHTRGIR